MAETWESDEDLAGGREDPLVAKAAGIERRESLQRIRHKEWAVVAGLFFSAVMLFSFLCFVQSLIDLTQQKTAFNGHLIFLGSALIVPPTLIVFSLIRRLLSDPKPKTEKNDEGSLSPDLVKEIVMAIKQIRGQD